MRILHLEGGRNLYGGALQVLYLLRGLADERSVESVLACPRGSAIAREVQAEGVATVVPIPWGGELDPLLPFRLAACVRRERPSLVHVHSRRGADPWGILAARAAHVPCLLTRRVDNPEFPPWARAKYGSCARVAAISEGIRAVLLREGVPPGKVVTVRSAVDAGRWDRPGDREEFRRQFGLRPDERAVGVVAQLIPRKGHAVLLAALPAILSQVPAVRLLLFGQGREEEALRRSARALGILERVLFCGFRDDLPRWLGCLDLLVHPALMEGLGVSLLQASAAGIPIVATPAGGIPEAVRDGINGVLVPAGEVEPLAAAVIRLLLDRELARAMGEAGRRLVREEFSVRGMTEGNLRLYRELAG